MPGNQYIHAPVAVQTRMIQVYEKAFSSECLIRITTLSLTKRT